MTIDKWPVLLLLLCLVQTCYYDNEERLYEFVDPICDFTIVSYAQDITPIMATYCYRCHSNADQQGDLNLEGFDLIKLAVNDGSFYGSIIHDAGFSAMPPGGQKIPSCDTDKIKAWIDDGALNN